MKLGRNEKCWCKSGLKFKHCHYGRKQEQPISKGETIRESKKIGSRKSCYVPKELQSECTSRIIKAHTISKSGSLQAIADSSNHVLGLKIDLPNMIKHKGKLKPEKIGVNQASTFMCFCSYHDKQLFACIEDKKFVGDEEQCFALAYRAVAKELYAKEGGLKTSDLLKSSDKGNAPIEQMFIHSFAAKNELGAKAAQSELSMFKKQLDDRLVNNIELDMRHLIIASNAPPPVVVSSIVAPTIDFEGNQLQDLGDLSVIPDYVIFNSFVSEGKGFVVFSWLKNATITQSFIDTLLNIELPNMFGALIRFFFGFAENTFISPAWWDGLLSRKQRKIQNLIMSGVSPLHPDSIDKLVDDGVQFDGWEIQNVSKLNF